MNTRYKTVAEAEADGWRRIDHSIDRDVSDVGFSGYDYESPEGQFSREIHISEARNKIGKLGAYLPMIRKVKV